MSDKFNDSYHNDKIFDKNQDKSPYKKNDKSFEQNKGMQNNSQNQLNIKQQNDSFNDQTPYLQSQVNEFVDINNINKNDYKQDDSFKQQRDLSRGVNDAQGSMNNSTDLKQLQVDQLVKQNSNLRDQLKEMATLLDQIIQKEAEQKKQKFGQNNKQSENELIKQKRKELQQQQEIMTQNRIVIQQKKRQLEFNYDVNRITEKENEIRKLKRDLEELVSEKNGLKKIQEEQKKAKMDYERQEYKDQLEQVKRQYSNIKDDNQKLSDDIILKERELKKYIDELKQRTEKIRIVSVKIKEQQRKKPNAVDKEALSDEDITEEGLQILEEKVIDIEKEKQDLEKVFVEKMKTLERERKQQQQQADKKLLVLKDKEKLTTMKIKEISKFIKATALENERKLQIQNKQILQMEHENQMLINQASKSRTHIGSQNKLPQNL